MEGKRVTSGAVRLDGFQVKLIALVIMTIDHLAAFGAFPMDGQLYSDMRLIGRVAAPLFLFMNVEALRHTRSRAKFLLRLYLAGVIVGGVNALFAAWKPGTVAADLGNMFPTFLYVGLFAYSIEALRRHERFGKCLAAICGLLLPFACAALDVWLYWSGHAALRPWVRAVLPSPTSADYSLLFILLGVVWYLVDDRAINCLIFLGLSLLSRAVPVQLFFGEPFTSVPFLHPDVFTVWHLFTPTQWAMVFGLPIMLCYSGERGRGMKYLFYLYYPLHQYLIVLISLLWH